MFDKLEDSILKFQLCSECDGRQIDDGKSDCYNCQTEGCDGRRFCGECLLCGSEACWEGSMNINEDMLVCIKYESTFKIAHCICNICNQVMEFVSIATSNEIISDPSPKHYVRRPKDESLNGIWTWHCQECQMGLVTEYNE